MSKIDGKFLKRFWIDEAPSGTIDGINTIFTLSQVPLENDCVSIYIAGLRLIPITNFSISSGTITFVVAPAIASVIRVQYVRKTGE